MLTSDDLAKKTTWLSAEIANGRLAMMGIIGFTTDGSEDNFQRRPQTNFYIGATTC